MVPASNLRQCPLLLHISTAPANPPHALQASMVFGAGCLYGGPKGKSERSSCFGGFTILPGFMSPFGSNHDLISASDAVSRGPKKGAIHSERTRPSPCSPEYAPL